MKAPAFQFYPGDWLRDLALRRCSMRARGLWADMLCLMHQGMPYGHLTGPGGPITEQELARMVGEPLLMVRTDLRQLEKSAVFSRTPEGVIFSRRMVRDAELRTQRAAWGTTLGGLDHDRAVEYGKQGGRPRKATEGGLENPLEGGSENPLEAFSKTPPSSSSSSSSTKRKKEGIQTRAVPLPPWVADLPFPSPPPDWWTRMAKLFPGLDQEAVAKDAASYWLSQPKGRYRDVPRFLGNQFRRAWAQRRAGAAVADRLPRFVHDADFTPEGDVTPEARAREAARIAALGPA